MVLKFDYYGMNETKYKDYSYMVNNSCKKW